VLENLHSNIFRYSKLNLTAVTVSKLSEIAASIKMVMSTYTEHIAKTYKLWTVVMSRERYKM